MSNARSSRLPVSEPSLPPNWYAVATRSRHERIVAHQLNRVGITTFLPCLLEMHRWSDRRKTLEMPLFPGYIFLHGSLSASLRRHIAFAHGTVGFIALRGEPIAIPGEQIDAIRKLVSVGATCFAHPYLKIGQRVRVRGGALDGIEGILTESDGQSGLVISVDNISRSLLIRIQGYWVEPT